jgi:hypothetical protein
MKKFLSISSAVIVNITLLVTFIKLVNPFDCTYWFMLTHPEFFFSPSVDYNIVMVGSFLGLIAFNLNLLLNRKK